jgi:hypothetical protein
MPASTSLGSGTFAEAATVAGGVGAGADGGAETQALSKNPKAVTPITAALFTAALFRFSLSRFNRFPKSNQLCRMLPEWR